MVRIPYFRILTKIEVNLTALQVYYDRWKIFDLQYKHQSTASHQQWENTRASCSYPTFPPSENLLSKNLIHHVPIHATRFPAIEPDLVQLICTPLTKHRGYAYILNARHCQTFPPRNPHGIRCTEPTDYVPARYH